MFFPEGKAWGADYDYASHSYSEAQHFISGPCGASAETREAHYVFHCQPLRETNVTYNLSHWAELVG